MSAIEPSEGHAEDSPREDGADPGEIARDLLEQIVELIGLEASVSLEQLPEETYRLEVTGEDLGLLIGREGSTINAVQYLVGLIAHKKAGRRVRVIVDAANYRSRREDLLRDMALSYAQQVKETGQEAVLDALHSYERRIIHMALVDDPDVHTYSEGEEPDRRVVISPRESE
jgi:spoIIIJ-associated protein